jgi:HEPN domain-containing protein
MTEKLTPELVRKRRIEGFLLIAGEELDGAGRFAEPLPRQASYFLQQTVEKLLRAVLEVEGIPAGPSHSILGLAQMLPGEHALKNEFLQFDDLSTASTRYRYPNERGVVRSVDPKQVASRLDDVRSLDRAVRAFLQTRVK